MRIRAALVASLLVAAACASGPTNGTLAPTAGTPAPTVGTPAPTVGTPAPTVGTPAATLIVDGQAEDGAFRVTIHAQRTTYRTSEAIGISATLTYLGPEPTVDVLGSGSGLVGFALRQLDGHLRMDPGWLQSCRTYPMEHGAIVALPYVKSGGFIPTDPDGPFWQAFFADRDLHLPAGTWQIDAVLDAYLGSCGGERHQLTASVVVRVEP